MREDISGFGGFLDVENAEEYKDFLKQNPDYVHMMNPKQLGRLQVAYDILKIITKGTGINVDYRLNQEKSYPFNTVSSISVTGKIIEFSSCEWLSKVSKLASNISFYPLTNGKIEYILTFHNSVITYSAKGWDNGS